MVAPMVGPRVPRPPTRRSTTTPTTRRTSAGASTSVAGAPRRTGAVDQLQLVDPPGRCDHHLRRHRVHPYLPYRLKARPEHVIKLLTFHNMNRYLLSKLLFGVFAATTVIIFAYLYTGAFIGLVGSIEAAVIIYAVNTLFLLVSLLWYIREKAYKNTPKRSESEILEAYAKREAANSGHKIDTINSDNNDEDKEV